MSLSSKRLFKGDPVIWIIYFFLCLISLVEVYSAASSLSYRTGNFLMPLFRQGAFLLAGTVCAWGFHNIPCRFFRIIPILGGPLAIFLLLITLISGVTLNGGSRWLNILGFSFQPSELAKGVVVTAVALCLAQNRTEDGANPKACKRIVTLAIVMCGLILTENLSTAVILAGTVFVMMFIGRVPMRQLGKLLGVCLIAGVVGLIAVTAIPSSTLKELPMLHRAGVWKERIASHSSQEANDTVFLNEHVQEAHARIAIASSNIVGKFPGNSEQRDYLPQAFSDFIYAIIIEEMGIFGAVFVALLYVILLFRAGRIANRCQRNFPAFLTLGLAILLVSQAVVNMLVAVGVVPVTGQPLPLISRGGTSTIFNCVYFGMILSVSRFALRTPEEKKAKADPAEPEEEAIEDEMKRDDGMN